MILNNAQNMMLGDKQIERVYRGNELVWEKQGDLPSGYKRCKYIESSGHQYINTKVLGNDNTRIKLMFSVSGNIALPYTLFGYRNNNSTGNNITLSLQRIDALSGRINFGIGVEAIGVFEFADVPGLTDPNVIHTIDGNTDRLIIDGVQKPFSGTCTGNSNIALFCRFEAAGTSVANLSSIKVYSFRLLKNDTSEIQADLIPCRREIDGEIGMYNLIKHEFIVNKGTGKFGYELMDGTYVAPI